MTTEPDMPVWAAINRVFADMNVVRDVHEVVKFSACLDFGPLQRSPVNRRICPDFHVVPNINLPDLGEIFSNLSPSAT